MRGYYNMIVITFYHYLTFCVLSYNKGFPVLVQGRCYLSFSQVLNIFQPGQSVSSQSVSQWLLSVSAGSLAGPAPALVSLGKIPVVPDRQSARQHESNSRLVSSSSYRQR